jgi:dTDP-4-amino-4,6-dideoxygalactose transaminase
LIDLQNWLKTKDILTKRYFKPALNTLRQLYTATEPMPHAEFVAERVLCLPIHFGLDDRDIYAVISGIKAYFQK